MIKIMIKYKFFEIQKKLPLIIQNIIRVIITV